ncbi:MAG: cell division protein FtsQ [Pseudomonadales bacterium]|nr:cell division protein FtsQ [Pseudomonadales bacterium]
MDVARDWPEGLIVTVHEEEAIAYGNDNAFIDEDGAVFQSPWEEGGRLPQLYGPEGKEKEVMSQYQQLSQALLRTGQSIDTLVLDERGGWQFTDRSGMRVRLGKENIMERMQRYFVVFQRANLLEEMAKIRSVDTRYPDGVAVDWKDVVDGYEVAKAYKTQREMSL